MHSFLWMSNVPLFICLSMLYRVLCICESLIYLPLEDVAYWSCAPQRTTGFRSWALCRAVSFRDTCACDSTCSHHLRGNGLRPRCMLREPRGSCQGSKAVQTATALPPSLQGESWPQDISLHGGSSCKWHHLFSHILFLTVIGPAQSSLSL